MNLYRNVDTERIQFDYLCHRDGEGAYDEEIRRLGGEIYHVPRCNPLDPGYYRSLNRFFGEHGYKVVHSHIDCMSALPLRAARKHGVATRIAHSHSSNQDKDLKYPVKLLCKRLIPREATHLLACGEQAGRWMFGDCDFTVVPNAIDANAFAFDPSRRNVARLALEIPSGATVIGHVGRFDQVKNHEFLLDAFALLAKKEDVILLLAGDGPTRRDMEEAATKLGISERVRFLGVRDDVPNLLSAMDVFVLPSKYEGLPVVLVEAQASGLPCLVSDGVPEECDVTGTGINRLPLEAGTAAWASELERLVATDVQREGGADRVASAGYDARVVAKHFETFYLSAAGLINNSNAE